MSKKSVIEATARDYDMQYYEVERIYDLYYDTEEFYERLEEFIKERAKNGY